MSLVRQTLPQDKLFELQRKENEISLAITNGQIESIRSIFPNTDYIDYIVQPPLASSALDDAVNKKQLEIIKYFITLGTNCSYWTEDKGLKKLNAVLERAIKQNNSGQIDKDIVLLLIKTIPNLPNLMVTYILRLILRHFKDNADLVIALAKKNNGDNFAKYVENLEQDILCDAFSSNHSENNISLLLALGVKVGATTRDNCHFFYQNCDFQSNRSFALDGIRQKIRENLAIPDKKSQMRALLQLDLDRENIVYISKDLYEKLEKENLLDKKKIFFILESDNSGLIYYYKDKQTFRVNFGQEYFGKLLNVLYARVEFVKYFDLLGFSIKSKVDGLIRLNEGRDFEGYNFRDNNEIFKLDFSNVRLSGSIIDKEQLKKIRSLVSVVIDVDTLKKSGFSIESDMFSMNRYGDDVIELRRTIVTQYVYYINQESNFSNLLERLCLFHNDKTNILKLSKYKVENKFKDTNSYLKIMFLGQYKLFALSRLNGFQYQQEFNSRLSEIFLNNYLQSEEYIKKFIGDDNWESHLCNDPVSSIANSSNSSMARPLMQLGGKVKTEESKNRDEKTINNNSNSSIVSQSMWKTGRQMTRITEEQLALNQWSSAIDFHAYV